MSETVTPLTFGSGRSEESIIEGLRQYFEVETGPNHYVLRCKRCKEGWSLKRGHRQPGNFLYLLNHAYGHK